jgi:hypothetical protein
MARVIDFNRFRNYEELQELTDAERVLYDQAQMRIVFGADVKFDERGKPIETGRGSKSNITATHLAALQKEQERINRLKSEALLAATSDAGSISATDLPAAMQGEVDKLKAATEAAEKAREDFERRLADLNAAPAL